MSFDNHDVYQRAPFSLVPPKIIHDIKTRLLFDDIVSRQVMHDMLGWNYNDIVLYQKTGDRDPLQKMFDMMAKHEPECVITCADVNTHFRQRKCFPIIKVHSILKPLSPVCNFLENKETMIEVINEVKERRNNKERYPGAREFKIDSNENDKFFDYKKKPIQFQWLRNLMSKKVNLLVVNITPTDSASISTLRPISFINNTPLGEFSSEEFNKLALRNLIENLARNFSCLMTPHPITSEWNAFIDAQFEKATFLIIVLSDAFIFQPSNDSLNSVPDLLSAHHKYLWNKVITSDVPTVGVVFDKNILNEAEKFLIPVFLLPKEMEFLLNYIIEF